MKPTEYPKNFLNSKLTGDYYDWVISSIEESNYDVSEILGNKKTTTILQVYEASKKLLRKRKNKTEAKKLGDELSTIVMECHNEFVKGKSGVKNDDKKIKKSLGRTKNLTYVDEHIAKSEKKREFANAIVDGDLDKVKQLVNEVDVNEKLDNGLGSPLFLSLDSGKYDVANLLIQKGANINEEVRGVSIIMDFVTKNDYESVKLLSDMGADLSYKTKEGYNVFVLAIFNRNEKIFDKLMERFEMGVHDGEFKIYTEEGIVFNLDLQNDKGSYKGNLLSFAIADCGEKSDDYGINLDVTETQESVYKKEIVESILKKYSKYEINQGNGGYNALYHAISTNNVEAADMLIDVGADAKIKVDYNDSLYKFAKRRGNKEMIKVVGKKLSFIDKILDF